MENGVIIYHQWAKGTYLFKVISIESSVNQIPYLECHNICYYKQCFVLNG